MASDERRITVDTEDEIEKSKPLEEADRGPSTSNKPLDEMPITITEDERKKWKLSGEYDTGPLTSNKPLIQEVTSILSYCYSQGEFIRYFKPTSVAIGPLNHQKKTEREWRFDRGEKWKRRLAAMFIDFSNGTEQDFYKNVKKEINSLRHCYNFKEEQKWTDEKWVRVFLVDGYALLLFILLDVSHEWEEFRVTNGLAGIRKADFFLLENQLPYQLLEILIDSSAEFSCAELPPKLKSFEKSKLKKFFKKSITEFINRSFLSLTAQQQEEEQQKQEEEQQEEEEEEEEDPVHLLDLLRRRLMGVKTKKKGEKQQPINKDGLLNKLLKGDKSKHWLSIHNVKELKYEGIRFKAREKADAITEIDFNDRCGGPTLTLAPIWLHNTTMPLLLNLMAYELCPDFEEDCKITSHLSFLDSFIDDKEDVKQLRDAGVLHHGLGSDKAVAELFNKISGILEPNLVINPELTSQIHAYCNSMHNMGDDENQITLNQREIFQCKRLDKQITLSDDENETDAAPSPSNKPLIQMLPQILHSCYGKEDCERYFKPTSVVIGPLNHQRETDEDSRIKRVTECKLKLASGFIQNGVSGRTEEFYKNFKKEINSLKNCYNSEELEKWSIEELAWMFVVDGCALLGFIILDLNHGLEDFIVDNDLVSIEKIEKIDFFLLENQLPYQLLKILTGTVAEVSPLSNVINLKELLNEFITKFINGIFLSPTAQQQHQIQIDISLSHHPDEQQQDEEDPPHLLDLLRRRLMGAKWKKKGEKQKRSSKARWQVTRPDDDSKHWPSIRKAKELKDKGIRFKAREKGGAITDIDFNDHCCVPTLTLTPIFLHNITMPLLLNLMAYELCPDFKEDCKITSYLSFLDSLIDNGDDVKDLSDAGVLHNGLGSDKAVAELFNKISGILVSNLEIDSELRHNIHEYCNKKSHFSSLRASIQAELTHTYFRSPWSFLVFLAALAGLIMTGMQTYYSFHEKKLPY